ncbi:carboxypeptidase regulatory-like domain-containing protein [Synechococcales cyanobacterium C]|uniref:Carboxypeptidase regulatory-like domain-containing protein n=1 Tax=Petrachloros mirabilis ULC683 TaxID=2781853 RepID=A0A8K2ANB2_9CYAN|nr:carboxypeptidase regulatory-like domain-containing protein [Petrachloros mirabilis]NCJ05253.1 carboxypeptidase regulatory-like domain-containing protein [Petrachloros mirabilis ULC683]
MRSYWSAIFGGLGIIGLQSVPVWGHGVVITHEVQRAIAIQARYDTGEPMAAAQVTVYAPDDPTTPWLTDTTTADGEFLFTPDLGQPGTWEVQVRQAGHGQILAIPITETAAGLEITSGEAAQGAPNPLQRGLMIGSVVWGCVGTALFFSRKPKA